MILRKYFNNTALSQYMDSTQVYIALIKMDFNTFASKAGFVSITKFQVVIFIQQLMQRITYKYISMHVHISYNVRS